MIIKYLQYTIIILVMLLSCQIQEEFGFQSCLQQAGDNRYELEYIINHFEQVPNSQKIDASNFLIRNMQYHSTSTSREVERYYEQMDSICQLTPTRWSISREQDSLFNALECPFGKQLVKVYDTSDRYYIDVKGIGHPNVLTLKF